MSKHRKRTKTTCVYLIQVGDDGPYKIGQAQDPAKRIKELQTASPDKLYLRAFISGVPGSFESQLHSKLAEFHIRGEWFEPVAAVEKEFFLREGPATFIYTYSYPHPGIDGLTSEVPIGGRLPQSVFDSMLNRIEELGISEEVYLRSLVERDLASL